jgi:hypothetical protein
VITVQSMLDLLVLRLVEEDRDRWLRRTHLHPRSQPRSQPARRPLRRWLGRQMIRAGAHLAAETTMRPVRSR